MLHCGQLCLLNISSFSLTLLIQVIHSWFLAQIVFFNVLEGVFFFSPSVLTTSLLWSPHPVIHLPHFVALICWAPNSNQDTFLPECPHALDDCLKGLNPTWFQPVFPASFSRRLFPLWHYSSWRFWASPMDAMHFYATSCSSFSSCSAPLTFHDPNHAFLHLLPSSGSIDSQSLPLLCFHSTSWICEFVFIVMI